MTASGSPERPYGNIDYSRIPLSIVSRIEVVRGASSVLYGSNAMGAVVNVITKEPRHKYEVTASLRYGTPYQRNGGDSLAGNASARDSREYRNKLDLLNLNADMTFGVNLGKFRSLTAVAYRTSDAYRLVGTRDEVRHYKELNIMRPKMNGSRPEMDPSTGMPVFVVGRTVADTTISVGPDSRGLSVSGWRDPEPQPAVRLRAVRPVPVPAFGKLFRQETVRFQRQHSRRESAGE